MELIRKRAFARAGLVGNPSDGYQGRTLSISVRDFWADVVLYQWDHVELVLSQEDRSRFRTVHDLVRDVELHGYYGGVRLVKATIKKFVEYCDARGLPIDDRTFSVRYESNIPRQVGLAGSSAIIVATLRCLMAFYDVDIPLRVQPSLALSVEVDELGIAAGLQDRVIQVYEDLVAMDFGPEKTDSVDGFVCGTYRPLDSALLPPLYVAYRTDLGEPTEVVHNDLRDRYQRGDTDVRQAMQRVAGLVVEATEALIRHDSGRLGQLIDENFDLRRQMCRIPSGQMEMIEQARQAGATAKFAGSGGAIIGTYPDRRTFEQLSQAMAAIGCQLFKPRIAPEFP
ncbi:MAG: mevalonate kinase [Pirellulales bacterium]